MNNPIPVEALPDWFREAVQLKQDTEHGVRNIEIALRHAMSRQGLDPRLRTELQLLRDTLGAVKVSLSVVEMAADRVLRDITGRALADREQAAQSQMLQS